jgi:hypothetical protein
MPLMTDIALTQPYRNRGEVGALVATITKRLIFALSTRAVIKFKNGVEEGRGET